MDLDQAMALNVPIYYLFIALALLGGGWALIRKVGALASAAGSALAGKFNVGMIAAAVFVSGGLAGLGFSSGELFSGPTVLAPESEDSFQLSKSDLIALASNNEVNEERFNTILEYTSAREQYCMSQAEPKVQEEKKVELVPGERSLPISSATSLLGLSLSLLICGIVTFFRTLS